MDRRGRLHLNMIMVMMMFMGRLVFYRGIDMLLVSLRMRL